MAVYHFIFFIKKYTTYSKLSNKNTNPGIIIIL